LREAFWEALGLVIRSVPATNLPPYPEPQSPRRAISLISALQMEDANGRNNLVYLQTLILMAIAAGIQGPSAQSGPSQAVWIGNAVSIAYQLRLHVAKNDLIHDSDRDSDEQLERRVWLSLVILDRFHAAGASTPAVIPDTAIVLLTDDSQILGEPIFQLARK
jgi:hypothetical protein